VSDASSQQDSTEPEPDPSELGSPEWGAALAIVAHGLLTPVAVVRGFAETLLSHWESLEPQNRDDYLRRILDNADFVAESLKDLARGLPPGASQVLDELDAESTRRYLQS
jgi:signal transduction histidine kinase